MYSIKCLLKSNLVIHVDFLDKNIDNLMLFYQTGHAQKCSLQTTLSTNIDIASNWTDLLFCYLISIFLISAQVRNKDLMLFYQTGHALCKHLSTNTDIVTNWRPLILLLNLVT